MHQRRAEKRCIAPRTWSLRLLWKSDLGANLQASPQGEYFGTLRLHVTEAPGWVSCPM